MSSSKSKPIYNMCQFCARFFPKAHAAKTCRCYPLPLNPAERILVIRSRNPR